VSEKYSFIDAEYDNAIADEAENAPNIVQMCHWLAVSNSGYYEWRSRPVSAAGKRRELLKLKVKAIFEANNEEYGYRRVHRALARGGEECCPELVRSVMRELGLEPCQPKPQTSSTAISPRKSQAKKWLGISPTSKPGKAGSTSRPSSTARHGK
jgi:putative transposase